MKKIITDTLNLASLMILVVFIVSIFWAGFTQEIVLVLELFLLSLLLSITNYIFETITSLPLIYNYIVKYLLVSCIVILLVGFIEAISLQHLSM